MTTTYYSATYTLHLDQDLIRGGWWLGFSASDPDTFYAIKDAIASLPWPVRKYSPDRRVWWVASETYLLELRWIVPDIGEALDCARGWRRQQSGQGQHRQQRQYGGSTSHQQRGPQVPPAVAQAFETLGLLPSADPRLIASARRILALEAHPDHGGSHQRMLVINLAADTCEAWATRHQQEPHWA
jgi:hypothetical protein